VRQGKDVKLSNLQAVASVLGLELELVYLGRGGFKGSFCRTVSNSSGDA